VDETRHPTTNGVHTETRLDVAVDRLVRPPWQSQQPDCVAASGRCWTVPGGFAGWLRDGGVHEGTTARLLRQEEKSTPLQVRPSFGAKG
jgi:hypothetical protein